MLALAQAWADAPLARRCSIAPAASPLRRPPPCNLATDGLKLLRSRTRDRLARMGGEGPYGRLRLLVLRVLAECWVEPVGAPSYGAGKCQRSRTVCQYERPPPRPAFLTLRIRVDFQLLPGPLPHLLHLAVGV